MLPLKSSLKRPAARPGEFCEREGVRAPSDTGTSDAVSRSLRAGRSSPERPGLQTRRVVNRRLRHSKRAWGGMSVARPQALPAGRRPAVTATSRAGRFSGVCCKGEAGRNAISHPRVP